MSAPKLLPISQRKMSRRKPNSSMEGWTRATELRINNDDMECEPLSQAESESRLVASLEVSPEGSLMEQGCESATFVTSQQQGATASGNRSHSPLEHSPMSSATTIFLDPQLCSLEIEEESPQLKMDPSNQNYTLASSSYKSSFPGSLVPRSAIPRTVDPEIDATTIVTLFPDTLQDLSDSEIFRKIADCDRFRDMAYAQEPVPLPPEAKKADGGASEQPIQSKISLSLQNAPAAETRQQQPRIQVPEENSEEEVDDDQGNSSNGQRETHKHQH